MTTVVPTGGSGKLGRLKDRFFPNVPWLSSGGSGE
jgi:hypothetical protein